MWYGVDRADDDGTCAVRLLDLDRDLLARLNRVDAERRCHWGIVRPAVSGARRPDGQGRDVSTSDHREGRGLHPDGPDDLLSVDLRARSARLCGSLHAQESPLADLKFLACQQAACMQVGELHKLIHRTRWLCCVLLRWPAELTRRPVDLRCELAGQTHLAVGAG